MEIKPLQLKQNKLMDHYRNGKMDILNQFDYNPYAADAYQHRLKDLNEGTFDREQLVTVLYEVNKNWNGSAHTYQNIDKLKQEDSVVVVGGQQAGLLTGPFYTIHKIISIIQFAKQQEDALHVPVIPVFWIAGEDHDFAEINHIFMPQTSYMEKNKLLQRVSEKWSVSDIPIEKGDIDQWIKRIFEQLQETAYTSELYETVMKQMEASKSYVDFFARLIYVLFQEEGIVLIDSHHPEMRAFEKGFFINMINEQEAISKGVWQEQKKLQEKGYQLTLDVDKNDSHLFYHNENERILLVKNEEGNWVGKQNELSFTKQELLQIARTTPELLSNNVVTRPVMQEMVFPTLAFIGGPGEVNYWSMLKPAFHALGVKMPPVVPRLSFTYVDRQTEKILSKYEIPVKEAIEHGISMMKAEWLDGKNDPSVQQVSDQVKADIERIHQPLREIASQTRSDIRHLADKNLQYLKRDVEYLEERIVKAIEEIYAHEISEFDTVDICLHPMDGLQERVWNPVVWINMYGTEFIHELTDKNLSFSNDHYVVYI